MRSYVNYLNDAMRLLAQDKRTIFIGQTVLYPGSAMHKTLCGMPKERCIELPVFEDTQMGISIGLSLMGYIPISVYPRFDFLLCAMNQLVNHLDKCAEMTHGEFAPKVIIRTAVGSKTPLYPGVQHCQDYTEACKILLKIVRVVVLEQVADILPAYEKTRGDAHSYLIIEKAALDERMA